MAIGNCEHASKFHAQQLANRVGICIRHQVIAFRTLELATTAGAFALVSRCANLMHISLHMQRGHWQLLAIRNCQQVSKSMYGSLPTYAVDILQLSSDERVQ